jgi:alpha-tubulin suppressor-like RCC1 family protein
MAIAAGEAHSMALKSDGTVWTWGNNESGQAGNGTQNSKENPGITTPTLVPSLQNGGPGSKIAIAEGGLPGGGPELNGGMVKYGAGYCLVVTSGGDIFTWGASEWNTYEPWTDSFNIGPQLIFGLTGITNIVGGGNFAVALMK